MPMMKNIASSWAKVFESDLLTSFEKGVVRAVKSLLEEFHDSCTVGLRERAKNQSEMCIEEVKVSLKKTVDVVSEQLQSSQKDVSRGLAPHVQDQLYDGYATAMLEKGRGSVARQKVRSLLHIVQCRARANVNDIYSQSSTILSTKKRITSSKVAPIPSWRDWMLWLLTLGKRSLDRWKISPTRFESSVDCLRALLTVFCMQVEVNLAVLWEGPVDVKSNITERTEAISHVSSIVDQLVLWDAADNIRPKCIAPPS